MVQFVLILVVVPHQNRYFFEGTIVYAKTINLGGWYITNDVALGLHTSFEHAEGIKNLYGNTIMGANERSASYILRKYNGNHKIVGMIPHTPISE